MTTDALGHAIKTEDLRAAHDAAKRGGLLASADLSDSLALIERAESAGDGIRRDTFAAAAALIINDGLQR